MVKRGAATSIFIGSIPILDSLPLWSNGLRHDTSNVEDGSSILSKGAIRSAGCVFTLVAQQTEQVASNHKVVGAIPTKGTKCVFVVRSWN